MALLRTYRRFLEILGWCELGLAVVLLFGIVASIGAQVVSRYFFNNPLIWVEEAVVYGFIWLVFLGASVGLKTQRHIRIEWLSHIWGGRWAAGALFNPPRRCHCHCRVGVSLCFGGDEYRKP